MVENGLSGILKWLTNYWVVALVVSVVPVVLLFFNQAIPGTAPHRDARWYRVLLYRYNGTAFYRRLIGGLLDAVDLWLMARTDKNLPDAVRRQGQEPFGWPLFDAALQFAIAYPIALLGITWAAGDGTAAMGSVVLLPGNVPVWQRGLIAVATILVLVLVLIVRTDLKQVWDRTRVNLAGIKLYVMVLLIASTISGAISGADADTISGVVAISGVATISGAILIAIAIAGAGAGAGAILIAIATVIASVGASTISGAGAISGAITGAGAGAIASAAAISGIGAEYYFSRQGWPLLGKIFSLLS